MSRLAHARLAGVLGLVFAAASHGAVFVNEIHYDDSTASGDVGERIEVVATAGEDLTQYSVVLYNGSNPAAAAAYDTDTLPAGSIVACGANVRIAVIQYATNGVQNGGNDAIALVGPGAALVQFLGYEGAATASDGPAAGLTSVDIGVSETNSTAPGTSLQLGGSGTAYADFTWNGTATETFGACNNGQSFGAPVDDAPEVTTTTPADAATDVAADASISIGFSESVTTTGEWFSISCSASGARAVADTTVAGSGAARTIDPDVDFEFEEECTVTIEAANVADLDGTIDPMPANHRFAFVVAAAPVDVAPSVDSIVPAAGATNVSTNANIVVKFTEPVTTSAAAFALSCGGSAHPFTLSGGPDTYTLDPDVDFDEVESCELVIDAEQVFDQDGAIDSMVADFLASFTTRAGAGDYYSGVDDSSCVALRATLHALIDDHVVYPYSSSSTDTWDILESADEDPLDASKVLDIYRNRSYTKVDCRTGVSSSCATGDANRYNREHTWPNSLGFGSDTLGGLPNPPYTDTHMLYVSAVDYNSNRGNKPYATCSTTSTCSSPENATDAYGGFGGGSGTYPGNSNWNLAGGYEVWNHRRGDAARAIFYMAVRYDGGTHGGTGQVEPDLEITDTSSLISTTPTGGKYYMGLRTTLLAWHEADAPDARESLRNDVVFSYQQNRNPFIDHPEWVEIAFADPCTGTAPTNQPPVLSDVAVSVLENAANGTTLTTLVASDPNAGQALTYSIQAGNASGAFAINAGTGAITVANAALVDRAVAASYALTVRATDNGTPAMSDDATLSITITQVNDAPSFTKGADAAVDEDAGSQAIANWATAISAGPSDESSQTVAFEVTGNTNTPLFAVAPAIAANGTLSFTPAANANGSATISFRARDSGGTANGGVDASGVQTLVVTVTPVNDAPTAGNANGAVVAGSAIGTQVATVTGTDVEGDTLAYAITSGNTGGAFAIDPATGAITVANSAAVTEAASPFALTITLTDDGTPARSGTATVTVSVTAAPPDALFAHGFE